MRCRWAAIVIILVFIAGCESISSMTGERYSKDSFNTCSPSANMPNVCYFKFNIKQVIPATSRVVGTVTREVVENNTERYGMKDFDSNTYTLGLEHNFQVKEADLDELKQKIGQDVCFKSIAGTSILEVDHDCPALRGLT